jgi:hypothetical protein
MWLRDRLNYTRRGLGHIVIDKKKYISFAHNFESLNLNLKRKMKFDPENGLKLQHIRLSHSKILKLEKFLRKNFGSRTGQDCTQNIVWLCWSTKHKQRIRFLSSSNGNKWVHQAKYYSSLLSEYRKLCFFYLNSLMFLKTRFHWNLESLISVFLVLTWTEISRFESTYVAYGTQVGHYASWTLIDF